jgi:hypothetical protein
MLIGLRDSSFEVGRVEMGHFFLSASILHRASNRTMEVIGIYGLTDHGQARGFLAEISDKIATCTLPLPMGGDFILIRSPTDKNNDNLNRPLIDILKWQHCFLGS